MAYCLVLQHDDLAACTWQASAAVLCGMQPQGRAWRMTVAQGWQPPFEVVEDWARQRIDWAVLPDLAFADIGLIVSDMDSTLITIECIDEIAAGVGLKEAVAEITEQSMRGELDFEQSLRRRVALLKGLPHTVLQQVYDEILQLSPGAETLLAECRRYGVKFMLVSGGFTFFTDRLQQRLGLDFAYGNRLAEDGEGRLNGELSGRIIDAQAKAELLREYRSRLGLQPHQVVAVGDGANDIPMLQEAGTGVAYHAKPKTRAAADACIDYGGLERLRGWFA